LRWRWWLFNWRRRRRKFWLTIRMKPCVKHFFHVIYIMDDIFWNTKYLFYKFVLFKHCCYCFVRWIVYHLSVCRKVNRQYKHHLSCTMHYHQRPYRWTHVRRYFTETWKIFTGNATITDDFADGLLSVSISQRVEKYLLEMPQSPIILQRDYCPSTFHRELKIYY